MSPSPAYVANGSGSASTASAETVAVSHVRRVEHYSQTNVDVARRINSSSFLAGGHSWTITFFSDDCRTDNTEWICFELRLAKRGTDGDVMVQIKCRFLDEVGETIPSSTRMGDSICTFRRTDQSRANSVSRLIKREHMESSCVRDGECRIRCDVTVIEVTPTLAVVPPSDLHRHFADFLDTHDTYAAHENVTATGWHVFKVEGSSQMKGIGVPRRIKSASFLAGGHTWCITFFPDGSRQEHSEWICFGLRLEDHGTEGDIVVRSKISFLDEVGEPIPSSTRTSLWTFRSTGQSWTFSPFKREDMESSYVRDDKFCIRCDVTVVDVASYHQMLAVKPPPDLHHHLADLLATGVGADVTFEVGGETFTAHKNILAARSSLFKAEFFGVLVKENVEAHATVRIDGIKSRVFEAMLHFIYTDTLPRIERGDGLVMSQHLLAAADMYNMERLVSICELKLCLFVDRSVAVSTLVLAEQHGCKQLKDLCFKILSSENYKVLVGDDLEHLVNSCPSLVNELCARFCQRAVCNVLQLKKKISSRARF